MKEQNYYLTQTWHINDHSKPFDRVFVREDSLQTHIDNVLTMVDHNGEDHMYFVKVLGIYPWSFVRPTAFAKSSEYRFFRAF